MSTVSSAQLMMWHEELGVTRGAIARQRQALRADPASGPDDPMRSGLDATFDALSATMSQLHHLWVLADITQ